MQQMGGHLFLLIFSLNQFCVTFSKDFSCFPGKMSYLPTDDPENPEEFFEGLSCGEVSVLGNFSLSSDDPRNYNDNITLISGSFQMRLILQVQIQTLSQLKLLQLLHQQVSHLLLQVDLLNLNLAWILLFNNFMKH